METKENINNFKAIIIAIKNRQADIVKLILERCPSATSLSDVHNQTALHWAVFKNNENIVKQLLNIIKLEDILKKKLGGYTVLHYAVDNKENDIINLIMDKVPFVAAIQDDLGQTSLHYCITNDTTEQFDPLFPRMSVEDISKVTKHGYTILHLLLRKSKGHTCTINITKQILGKCPKLASVVDEHGQTALHWASASGLLTVVMELLEILKGDEILIQSLAGRTAADFAKSIYIRNVIEVGAYEDYIG